MSTITADAGFIWAVVIGMALANYLTRFPPIAIVSRMELPGPVMRWLSFIPVSVMGALVALEVFRPGGSFTDPVSSPYVWAALPTALVYWRTRSFLGSTVAGMVLFVALRALLG
ncbi:MAG: AzlD domain-containing protein [Coriobacteriia bacterium]|nr:AzlD domain-containing protein [Coriobacteriia bacterium]